MSPPAENALPTPVVTTALHIVVGVEHLPDGGERVVHLFGDGVERLGAVDAHDVNVAALLDQQPRGELLVAGQGGDL